MRERIYCSVFSWRTQGNLVAIKHVNKKRIELTRQVLLELKHVSVSFVDLLFIMVQKLG